MEFKKVQYEKLNGKQKEIYNFQKVASELADYGFNCIKLADDWRGADFLAYHKDGSETLKVQLKSRITIAKKYLDKGLFITFPHNQQWYLIEHDQLVEIVSQNTSWLKTDSWQNKGQYTSLKPSKKLLGAISHAQI